MQGVAKPVPTGAIERLRRMILDDLDPVEGGLPWIRGQVDDKRCWLLSEYLYAAATGVEESLQHAEFCVDEYNQAEFTENNRIQRRLAAAEKLHREGRFPAGEQPFAWVIGDRNATDVKRQHRLEIFPQATFILLVQALDRLAAVTAIVAASAVKPPLPRADVLQIDWRGIRSVAVAGPQKGHEFRQQSAPGQELQQQVYDAVKDAPADCGPIDWLEWLLRARDTAAHRAPKIDWSIQLQGRGGGVAGVARPFHAQPGWGEVEAMLAKTDLRKSLMPMLLDDMPENTLRGLLGSTTKLVELVSAKLCQVVERRREDHSILIQPGGQWAEPFSVPTLNFPGYGRPPQTTRKEVVMLHPDTEKRLGAARIGSNWEKAWRE